MSQQINLFNPVFLKQKKYFSVMAMLQALGLIVLGCIAFYGFAWYQVLQLDAQKQEMTKHNDMERARLEELAREYSPQRSGKLLKDELQALEAQAAAQQNLLNSLKSGAIGNTQGFSEYMRAFARQSVSGLWLTGFEINGDGSDMSLQGAVTSPQLLPAFILRMNKEAVMRGKSFATLQMKRVRTADEKSGTGGYVEFSLHSVETAAGVKQ